MRVFVTGGAGFIGSHIVDKLLEKNYEVTVYDNLFTGRNDFIKQNSSNKNFSFIKGDINDLKNLTNFMKGYDAVFHLAANADVRGGINNTKISLEQNTFGTYNVLEAMRICDIKEIVFSSSATVYGEPQKFPTPEDYPLIQTSLYGASKLAGEAMIQAFSEYYSMKNWIFRFVSWIGERYTHGVIFDFVKKLMKNKSELEILGDGNQKKSYLYVKDGIDGIFLGWEKMRNKNNIFNLGHREYMNVVRVADIICEEMGLKKVRYKLTGGERGWLGDSPFVHLDITRISNLGWKPKVSIEEGIRRTARYLLESPKLLERR